MERIDYRIPRGSSGPIAAFILSFAAGVGLFWTKLYVLTEGYFSIGYQGIVEFLFYVAAGLMILYSLSVLFLGRIAPWLSAIIAVPSCILIAVAAPKALEFGYGILTDSAAVDLAYLKTSWVVLWLLPLFIIGVLVAYCTVCFKRAAGVSAPAIVIVLNIILWAFYSYIDASWVYKNTFDFAETLNKCILPYLSVGLFFIAMLVMICSFSKHPETVEQKMEQKAFQRAQFRQQKAAAQAAAFASRQQVSTEQMAQPMQSYVPAMPYNTDNGVPNTEVSEIPVIDAQNVETVSETVSEAARQAADVGPSIDESVPVADAGVDTSVTMSEPEAPAYDGQAPLAEQAKTQVAEDTQTADATEDQ